MYTDFKFDGANLENIRNIEIAQLGALNPITSSRPNSCFEDVEVIVEVDADKNNLLMISKTSTKGNAAQFGLIGKILKCKATFSSCEIIHSWIEQSKMKIFIKIKAGIVNIT